MYKVKVPFDKIKKKHHIKCNRKIFELLQYIYHIKLLMTMPSILQISQKQKFTFKKLQKIFFR